MSETYYRQVTKLMRRKGIDDHRILTTLNDIKGWVTQHPDERPQEHFGPAAALVRDLPRGKAVHAPQTILTWSIVAAVALIFLQIALGFFNIAFGLFGLPAPVWSVIIVAAGFIASRFAGAQLPENFKL